MDTPFVLERTQDAASERLSRAAELHQQTQAPSVHHYYGHVHLPEETIPRFFDDCPASARVTRNHYGSLILNASQALFIDIDVLSPGGASSSANSAGRRTARDRWRRTLNDLRQVLSGEREEGFRVYRTAAGYRVLAVSREFSPASESAERLMKRTGADTAFRFLCRVQNSFRARLTPKPWRCGAPCPPNQFPRDTADERSRFDEWLAQYETACRDRATCRFLESLGPRAVHEGVRPIVVLHDRETKAFEPLPLA